MKLLTPSGKMLQNKIRSLIKYAEETKYSIDDKNLDMNIREEQLKQSIISLVNKSILVK